MPRKSATKLTRSHTSIIDAAQAVVVAAQKHPEVDKISLGIIKQIGHTGGSRLKCQEISVGLLCSVRGSTTIQQLIIFTKNPAAVAEVLQNSL